MPIAPLVGAAIVAGAAGLGGAALSSSAAKKAADQQANAAQQGIDLQKQIYDQTTQQRAPYLAQGQAAVGRLGSLASSGQQMPLPAAYGAYGAQPLSSFNQPSPMPAQPAQPQLVTLRAPNGATQQVPQNQVAHFVQLGAKVVS